MQDDIGLMCEINNEDLIKTVTIKSPNDRFIKKFIIYPDD
jgi:hypothetical protein